MTNPESNHERSRNRELGKYTMAVTVMITGVAAHRIRKFEEAGLCNPVRTHSRQRLFSDYDIELIREIHDLEKQGINLMGIKVILNMRNSTRG